MFSTLPTCFGQPGPPSRRTFRICGNYLIVILKEVFVSKLIYYRTQLYYCIMKIVYVSSNIPVCEVLFCAKSRVIS